MAGEAPNTTVLLFLRFFLTVLILAMVGGLGWIALVHSLDGGALRIADAMLGGMMTLLTSNCYSWFFNSSAGSEQHAATISRQSDQLANAPPPTTPP